LPPDTLTAFFSYSRDDSEFALRLAEDLKVAGADVWLDQLDIAPGQRWPRAVQDALQNSPRILVILSPDSVGSNNVEDEVNFALDEQKTVIPVFYRDCKIPFRLRPLQYIDFRTDYDRGLKVLTKLLAVRHAPQPGTQAPSPVQKKRQLVAPAEVRRKRLAQPPRLKKKTKPAAKRPKVKQDRAVVPFGKAAATVEEPTPPSPPSDKMLQAWAARSASELHTLEGHSRSVGGVALSADGRLAVSVASNEPLKVWDLGSGSALRALSHPYVNDVALSADGRVAVSTSTNFQKQGETMFRVWDVANGHELRSAKINSGSLYGVVLSEDGRTALTASWYPYPSKSPVTMKVWDVVSGREQRTFQFGSRIHRLALSRDARLALIASNTMLELWDLENGLELRSFGDAVNGMALSADGRRAVTGSGKTVKIWDVGTGHIVRSLEGHWSKVIDVALSADGRMAVSASNDRNLNVWDAETGRGLATFTAYVDLACCAVSSDKTTIAAGDKNGAIHYLQI
jgi:hypothetical protein